MLPEYICLAGSIVISYFLEERKLVGAEVFVLASAAYGIIEAISQGPVMLASWFIFTLWCVVYFSKWKNWESEVPHPWLLVSRPRLPR